MNNVSDLRAKRAHQNGYSLGYAAALRRANRESPPPTQGLSGMVLFFQSMAAEYPNAVKSRRVKQWAEATRAYVDLMECEAQIAAPIEPRASVVELPAVELINSVDYRDVVRLLIAGGYASGDKVSQAVWILYPELRPDTAEAKP